MAFLLPSTITAFVRRGDLVGVQRRLAIGDDVNEHRSCTGSPLIEATRNNHLSIMELLLDNGADPEVVGPKKLTALHAAINEKNATAVKLLVERGADVNNSRFSGRSPLQCAIKKNLLEVASTLLAHGADPFVYSGTGKCAKDYLQYVRVGSDREKFEILLTAYTDLNSAIRERNIQAVETCLRKQLTGDANANVATIDAAIQLKHAGAVEIILQTALTTDTVEDMIIKVKSLEFGIKSAENPSWLKILLHVRDNFERDILLQVLQSQDVTQLQNLIEGAAMTDLVQTAKFNDGWTPLHLAASLGSNEMVEYLIVECALNPLVLDSDDKTALDLATENDSESELCWMLRQYMKKRVFSDYARLLLRTNEVTVEKLQELVGHMTSVDDLRIIFSLGFEALNAVDMHDVLTRAFGEVISEKLVFDDRVAVLFKMGLQECKRQGYISEMEQLEWDLKATKVNVENSDWVREIKRSLQVVECRVTTAENNIDMLQTQFSRLKDALIQREENLNKQRTRRRCISLLSSTLMMCGGAVINDLFGAAFDLWDPEQLLDFLSIDYVGDFLTDQTSEFIFKDGVEALFIDSDVDPMEFAHVLKDIAKIELTMDVESEILSSLNYKSEPDSANPLFPPKECTSSNMDSVLLTTQYATKVCVQEKTLDGEDTPKVASVPLANDFQMPEEEMQEYPYHYAVRFSNGDIDQFLELVQYIDGDDGDINETLSFYVNSAEVWETINATALVYASYLGYIEIVKWFLDRSDIEPTEKKFSTINRARSRSNLPIEVWTKAPTSCP
ncbi:hypothetical protein PHMEG_0008239 [Phytophthora megakarya]|uniref:Uncharacterized protein n=1 Tax=Phytophthora megakarya TaxID=4795 RepID=A0A225WJN7_9STRA|nr:hypothetical protein PHMEG_0008239 [Phytophthora megakarya]